MLECNVDVEIIHFSDFKHQQKKRKKIWLTQMIMKKKIWGYIK
jgi:hypothetical protein